jgi:hypothetical protein
MAPATRPTDSLLALVDVRFVNEPSTLDMLTTLRHQIIANPISALNPPDQPQPKKSWKSSEPGRSPPHNRKSRDYR